MMLRLRQINQQLNRRAIWLCAVGGVGVALRGWLLWRRDRALVVRGATAAAPDPGLRATPMVSALVAAWNEHAQIDAHLRSFLALRYPAIELILCAGGSDDTLALAQRYASARVTVLEQHPGEGKQRALARCLQHASGTIIYLTDADCIYADDALVPLLAALVNEGEQVATGSSRPLAQQMGRVLPRYLWASDAVANMHRPDYSRGILGRNAALTRAVLEQSGGLDFEARTGTDYQLAQRLLAHGAAIRFVRASEVASAYPETLRVYRQKQSRWLRNLLLHGWRYGAARDVWLTLRTVLIGALMVLAPLLAPLLGGWVLALWLSAVAHAASAKLRYVLLTSRLYRQPVPPRLLAALVPLSLIDCAIWAAPLLDLIRAKRRQQW